MALSACTVGQAPFLMSWTDSGGFLNEESGAPAASVCDLVEGSSFSGATGVCTVPDDYSETPMAVPVAQICWTDEYPDPTAPTTGIACTASAPCNFTLSNEQWSDLNGWMLIAFVVGCFALFCHGFGVGDART